MAFINITVKNGLFNIGLDNNDWTSLEVNGETVQGTYEGWNYHQPSEGLLQFKAEAYLTNIENPGNTFVLQGEGNNCYVCSIWYSSPFVLHGVLYPTLEISGAKKGPFGFSQPSMRGNFS